MSQATTEANESLGWLRHRVDRSDELAVRRGSSAVWAAALGGPSDELGQCPSLRVLSSAASASGALEQHHPERVVERRVAATRGVDEVGQDLGGLFVEVQPRRRWLVAAGRCCPFGPV